MLTCYQHASVACRSRVRRAKIMCCQQRTNINKAGSAKVEGQQRLLLGLLSCLVQCTTDVCSTTLK